MRKLVVSIVFSSVVAALATAGGGDKGAKGGTGGKLEGTWIATSAVSDGKKVPDEILKKFMLTVSFKDGKYTVVMAGDQVEAGTYKTDASKKPAAIDLNITEGKDKGKSQLGIYKVEGDTMTIAMTSHDKKDRPKNFDASDMGEVTVLKRK
jgi:uncharacterized protein (TIGR03067 family)